MPELPEVETTRRGIAERVAGQIITRLVVRDGRLRWPVAPELKDELPGKTIHAVNRRAKYLLFETESGNLIVHLGMSGSLRVVPAAQSPGKFDHVDIVLASGECLRLRDPRRFGAILWTTEAPGRHMLLSNLGPEPLQSEFSAEYLYGMTRGRRRAIRDVLLDGHIVAGIGNIYANEALFGAGIHPARPAGRISRARYVLLVRSVRATLKRAIRAGGTTLRDFQGSDGSPGYFQLRLKVYGRDRKPCPACSRAVRVQRLGSRSAFYCPGCQR